MALVFLYHLDISTEKKTRYSSFLFNYYDTNIIYFYLIPCLRYVNISPCSFSSHNTCILFCLHFAYIKTRKPLFTRLPVIFLSGDKPYFIKKGKEKLYFHSSSPLPNTLHFIKYILLSRSNPLFMPLSEH